ncbi:hypothetical protein PoHVEF18_005095 [Penicillium ochrochloron]
MPSQPPLPPLLTSYLSDQRESSLTLVSSILGATSNWLVLRYLYAALGTSSSSSVSIGTDELSNGAKRKVVLVSFLRGWEFWRAEAKRLGLDLARLADKQQFAFVDGLSELFNSSSPASSAQMNTGSAVRTTIPLRSQPGAVPGRGPPSAVTAVRPGTESLRQREPGAVKKLHFTGHGIAALDAMEKDIISEISRQKSSMTDGDETLLIIDQPDFLLAATGASMGIGATEMAEWVTDLQQVRGSTDGASLDTSTN